MPAHAISGVPERDHGPISAGDRFASSQVWWLNGDGWSALNAGQVADLTPATADPDTIVVQVI